MEGNESENDSCLNSTQSSSSHLSANTLPGQYLIPPSGTRKRQIEESDDTLVAQNDEQSSPQEPARGNTKRIGVIDTSKANDFGTHTSPFSPPTLVSAPTVISDAGNQQFKEFKARKEAVNDSTTKIITDGSASSLPWRSASSSARRRGPRSKPAREFELQQKLRNARQIIKNPMYHGHEKYFLPRGELERLINVESVTKELIARGFKEELAHTTAVHVCQETIVPGAKKDKIQSYQQIFAILVFMGQSCSIAYFMEDSVSDLDLPLVERKNPDSPGGNSLYRRHSSNDPLQCTDQWNEDQWIEWSPEQKRLFCEYQWLMMAPFFSLKTSNKVSHYNLEDQRLIPFINGKEILSGKSTQHDNEDVVDLEEIESGFSKVFMVWIHPQHHDLSRHECDRGFAVKQLMKPSEDDFNQEVEMLKKFIGDRSHPHIVSLLATYKQYGRYHMIFHRADGNLFEYWRDLCPIPKFNYDTVKWVAKQLAGLSDGLLRFHKHTSFLKCCEEPVQLDINGSGLLSDQSRPRKKARFEEGPAITYDSKEPEQDPAKPKTKYGQHGDLKPENVLWFPDPDDPIGILKISDLGQAQLHSTQSKTRRESNGVHTLTYRPPETDIEPYIMRQSGDIWSFGCIVLEFITWALGSWELVEDFKTKRASEDPYALIKSDTFYELKQVPSLNHSGAQIKPAVTQKVFGGRALRG
ncbi:serine threonine protein kinase [Fusarium avenaceum]|nr:serine threonine protein kinase [Fusarium avenaceum]